jgi:hypothetical protein
VLRRYDLPGAAAVKSIHEPGAPRQGTRLQQSGVQMTGAPPLQSGTVFMHGPEPQVCVPGSTLVHAPAVVPVQVPPAGCWQVAWQVSVAAPCEDEGHTAAADWQARAPLQAWIAALTLALW